MKKNSIFSIGLFLFVSLLPVSGQKLIPNSSITGVCYAGTKVKKIYIPAPKEFFRKSGAKSGASITIYYTGFSAQAEAALDKARLILQSILPADTKLTIIASWEKITKAGVLAQSSITAYAGGWFINALNPRVLYPVALAEKIAGKSLNNDLQGDVLLTVNSSINWYLGTDGQTPTTKYDLVTVALHEICHGLGFFDSMNSEGTAGAWGIGSFPIIYDTFIENLSGDRLTDTLKFRNHSASLLTQLTGGQIYFNGPLLKNYTLGGRAKLYAPPKWDAGSSISHLDDVASPNIDGLMTPFIDLGEAIHDPGKFTLSILGDLGWINTRIIPTPVRDTESHLTQVVLTAQIKSDTSYNRNKVGVVFSFNKFSTSNTLLMISPNSDNSFSATIKIPGYNSELQYYFFAEDVFLRLYRSPSLIDSLKYRVYIGKDTVKPVITHTPISFYLETIDTIRFNSTVTDNLGLDTVYLEYKINNGTSSFIGLSLGKSDSYSAFIKAKGLNLRGGDSISYRIFAIDTALLPNKSILPKTGYFAIRIENIEPVVDSYSTDFTGAAPDFLNFGFNISMPPFFSKYGLNTKHPYESPERNDASIEYTAMLRHPLKFKESGLLINFSEVVLVEPGETGSVFGSPNFYDYVILDGSKNFGKTWFNLTDGYDSRLYAVWDTAFNSSFAGQNSTFAGTENLLRKHTIFYRPSDKISAGDTLLLRFRLFSDPFANGWGWVIEDLKINPLIDAVEIIKSEPIIVYPNPGRGLVYITRSQIVPDGSKPMRYSVFNSSGICLIKDRIMGDSDTVIDLTAYSSGMYIIILYRDDGIKTIKYNLIK